LGLRLRAATVDGLTRVATRAARTAAARAALTAAGSSRPRAASSALTAAQERLPTRRATLQASLANI